MKKLYFVWVIGRCAYKKCGMEFATRTSIVSWAFCPYCGNKGINLTGKSFVVDEGAIK